MSVIFQKIIFKQLALQNRKSLRPAEGPVEGMLSTGLPRLTYFLQPVKILLYCMEDNFE